MALTVLTRRRFRIAMLAASTALPVIVDAAEDVEGAQDPPGFERYPGSRIVAYAAPGVVRNYAFVTGRVDRSGRAMRLDDSTRLDADVVRVTYRALDETRFVDVIDYYRDLVVGQGARVVFTCRARDCGRSTTWANSVFGVKELVAPDSSQFYLAATLGRRLLSVYVVQRGNRRVYAHIDVARAEKPFGADPASDLIDALAGRGYAVLAAVTPGPDGILDAADLAGIDAAAAEIAEAQGTPALAGEALYVVCHLSGAGGAEAALARSATCAETVAERLRAARVVAYGFGGGPLLPRPDAPARRVELVMPRHAP